ncbi:MAG: AI-2E family transporter [Candidatus Poseidoniales archaeon]|nr:MAG: AI-2E family transporter [Candidatus Poseidoniales archaeon]
MESRISSVRRSNSATIANFGIITLVGYLVLVNLKAILMPLAIAVLIYFLIRAPEQYLIERFDIVSRMPMLAYGVILAFGALVSYGVSILLYRNIDQFKDEMNKDGGLIDKFDEKWTNLGEANLYGLEDVITSQETIENVLDPQNIQDFATNILADLASFMTTMVTVAIFVIFIILEEKSLPGRFKAAFPGSYGSVRAIVSNSSEAISTYVISKATCSAGQAIVLAFLLWAMGIPGWFLFGVLCFLLDFVPILGALLATIPPMMIALIVLDPLQALLLGALMIANQQLFGSFIEPNLSGQRLGISPLVLLLTVMVSASVWGISGAIIGVPIMIIARIALEEDERTRPIALMLAMKVHEEE